MELKPVELFYEEEGEGLPVVFLHGFPLNHSIWLPVVRLLAGQGRFILPDLRGYGQSPDGNEIHSMRLLVEDVLLLLDRLKIERVILVGHSMGGYVSLHFAHAYPNRLAGLGLVSTQADADTPERRQARLRTARDVRTKGIELIANGMPSKLTDRPELQAELAEMFRKVNPQSAIRSLKGMAERQDANPWLDEIHVPVLVVSGGQDLLIPAEKSQEMVAMLNKGWLIEIPEAGHLPMMEAPQRVADGISQLISAATDN
jgi:pimeloyl-ACP methyl ester carboxylesterase